MGPRRPLAPYRAPTPFVSELSRLSCHRPQTPNMPDAHADARFVRQKDGMPWRGGVAQLLLHSQARGSIGEELPEGRLSTPGWNEAKNPGSPSRFLLPFLSAPETALVAHVGRHQGERTNAPGGLDMPPRTFQDGICFPVVPLQTVSVGPELMAVSQGPHDIPRCRAPKTASRAGEQLPQPGVWSSGSGTPG